MEKLMNGAYGYNTVALAYNCDVKGNLSLTSIMKELERVATQQLDGKGLNYIKMKNENMIFVVTKVNMRILRVPKSREEIKIMTTPQFTKGPYFMRKSQIGTMDGELLVECQAAWVLVDPDSRRILRPTDFKYDMDWNKDEPCDMDIFKKSVELTQNATTSYIKKVRYSDLDANNHMNNTLYATVIVDALPSINTMEKDITELYLHYQKECRLGDEIEIKIEKIADNRFVVAGFIEGVAHFISEIATN